MDKFFVIMPVWIQNNETYDLTFEAIKSLGDVDLIIIDNHSEDLYTRVLSRQAKIYLKNDNNLGFAKAVNQGLKLAPKGLVAIVNNDTIISPNYQEIIKEAFKTDSSILTVHPKMVDYDKPFDYGNRLADTQKNRWCQGSWFVINHDPERGFLYDENFKNSYDDWDFFYQIRKAGYKQAYTNMCCVRHKHSHTQVQIPEREENDKSNKEYFKQKHGKYAEELFAEEFPDQMAQDYWKGFD